MTANRQTRSLPLGQRMLRQVLLVAGGASLLFGLLFLGLYRDQLTREKVAASEQINHLLRAALENAMLKRDVPGLRDIITRLGSLPAISDVMVLEPGGEVRFASRAENMGRRFPELVAATPGNRFIDGVAGGEVLRSVTPVPNQPQCEACHGQLEKHPINGVLVVDVRADTLRREAWRSAALFALAGAVVLALTLLTVWRLLRQRVLQPLAELDRAACALSAGDLALRARASGDDEPGRLAGSFNRMADSLVEQIGLAEGQQRYLQELLDGLPDGVRVIRQSDMRIVAVNQAYCRQVEASEHEVLGQPCHLSSHGRDKPCPATLVVCPAQELKAPGQALKCRHRHRTAGGREFPVEVHAVLIERQNGAAPERLIVESTSDLSDVARLSQEQRLSELGLLAAGIAHEIHNPLGSIRLAVDGLLRSLRHNSADPARLANYLEMVNAEIDRCTGVTQRLLLLSRLPQQQAQVVPLNPAVGDTLQLIEYDARSHGIVQHVRLEPAEPRIMGDESDLRMLILNLVQNAHHAMPAGGELHVTTAIESDKAVLVIRDSGKGISADNIERIFDPFFSHRADGEGGTGLGLTICKSIVERYGGRIEVSSVLDQGTVFRVLFPLAGIDK